MFNHDSYNNLNSLMLNSTIDKKRRIEQERRCPVCDSKKYTQELIPVEQYIGAMSCMIKPLEPQRTCNKCGTTWQVYVDKLESFDYDKIKTKKRKKK